MVNSDLCCGSLNNDKILMKMGLGLVLVGHMNFLLGALVHGAVLRHIEVFSWNKKLVYPISNVIALVAGLVAIIGGISAIVLSKYKKNQLLSWFLLIVSVLAVLLGAASAVGITVATVRAIMWEGQTLFAHCNLPSNITYYSITNECPFDPTRIYDELIYKEGAIFWYYINPMVSIDSDVSGGGCVLLPLFLGLHFFPPVALPMEEKCQGSGVCPAARRNRTSTRRRSKRGGANRTEQPT